jgi:hypothetical protein
MKSRGLVCCWPCFNDRFDAAILDRAEAALLQAARAFAVQAATCLGIQQLNPATGRPFPPQRGEDIGYGPNIDETGYDWRNEDAVKAQSSTEEKPQ